MSNAFQYRTRHKPMRICVPHSNRKSKTYTDYANVDMMSTLKWSRQGNSDNPWLMNDFKQMRLRLRKKRYNRTTERSPSGWEFHNGHIVSRPIPYLINGENFKSEARLRIPPADTSEKFLHRVYFSFDAWSSRGSKMTSLNNDKRPWNEVSVQILWLTISVLLQRVKYATASSLTKSLTRDWISVK